MAISYPLALPTTAVASRIRFSARSVTGLQASPFSGEQTVYAHQGQWFEAQVSLPPMERADAEEWVAFLLALNGREGSFLMGDPAGASPRGTWLQGSPAASVDGAHAAGVLTVALKDLTPGATGKAGDWLQFGSGATAHLHKLVQDLAAGAGGAANAEIWPRTRAALAAGDAFVVSSAVGLWRLADNKRDWEIGEAVNYGIEFAAMEAF